MLPDLFLVNFSEEPDKKKPGLPKSLLQSIPALTPNSPLFKNKAQTKPQLRSANPLSYRKLLDKLIEERSGRVVTTETVSRPRCRLILFRSGKIPKPETPSCKTGPRIVKQGSGSTPPFLRTISHPTSAGKFPKTDMLSRFLIPGRGRPVQHSSAM